MTERFRKAYDALVRAFFEGTLAKGTCVACACGNIIFDAVGDNVTKDDLLQERSHCQRFFDVPEKRTRAFKLWGNKRRRLGSGWVANPEDENEVNVAGYTAVEFAKIETAFEGNTTISFMNYPAYSEHKILEDQYKGLAAVVDVLIELDESTENPDELKQKFREHPKLQVA